MTWRTALSQLQTSPPTQTQAMARFQTLQTRLATKRRGTQSATLTTADEARIAEADACLNAQLLAPSEPELTQALKAWDALWTGIFSRREGRTS